MKIFRVIYGEKTGALACLVHSLIIYVRLKYSFYKGLSPIPPLFANNILFLIAIFVKIQA